MTHNDYESLDQIRSRWQKEQQLIRQKYQIPYNMTYTSKQCYSKPISIASQDKISKNILTHNDLNRKISRSAKHNLNNDPNIPPMYCSKCHLNLTECTCSDGLGQWWINLQKRTHSTDKTSRNSSLNFIHERHINFVSSLTDLSSMERTNSQKSKSKQTKQQYVLLDWNNRQSLLNFIRTTTKLNQNLSTITLEQLHELITNNKTIHIFNSIIDLILSINKNQHQSFFCQIYIDSSYYSSIPNTIPLSQSDFIADNINLNRTIYSIQKIATLLGIKIDQSSNEFIQETNSTKQRKLILNQQSLFIASKVPYNNFCNTSLHTP